MKPLLILLALALATPAPFVKVLTAELRPETVRAFDRYIQATESRIDQEETRRDRFLYFDGLPAAERDQIVASLKQGEIVIRPLKTLDDAGHDIHVPGGLIHHWIGIVFIPRASVRDVLAIVQDYDHQAAYYRPQVVRSRLLSHHDDQFHVYLRFREKKVITVTLDTEHDVTYQQLDAGDWSSRSRATRIQEVRNAGERGEYDLPPGQGGGFLWRLDTYWRFAGRDGGVYVQCESISLTRDVPTGLEWLIEPFITSIPKESLELTLNATRRAVLKH